MVLDRSPSSAPHPETVARSANHRRVRRLPQERERRQPGGQGATSPSHAWRTNLDICSNKTLLHVRPAVWLALRGRGLHRQLRPRAGAGDVWWFRHLRTGRLYGRADPPPHGRRTAPTARLCGGALDGTLVGRPGWRNGTVRLSGPTLERVRSTLHGGDQAPVQIGCGFARAQLRACQAGQHGAGDRQLPQVVESSSGQGRAKRHHQQRHAQG